MTQYSDGRGGLHNTEEGARQAQRDADAPMNEMGNLATSVAGPVVGIILFIPGIISGIIGAIFGVFFKFGIVGRVIQSALVGIVIGIVLIIVADYVGVDVSNDLIGLLVAIPCFALPALWYYYSHYFRLKGLIIYAGDGKLSAGAAAAGIGAFFSVATIIMWVGCIILLIIQLALHYLGFFQIIKGYDSSKFPSIVYALPFVVAIVVYIISLGGDKKELVREEVKNIREKEKSPIIGAVLSAILPFALLWGLSSLPSSTQSTTEEKAIYEQEQAGVVAAKPAWTKKQEKIAAKCPAKSVLIIDAGGNYGTRPLYNEANRFSTPITELKHREILTSTGEMLFFSENAGYIPVEYKDVQGKVTKGWVAMPSGGKYEKHNVKVLIGKIDSKITFFYADVPSREDQHDKSKRKKISNGKKVTVTGEISIKEYGRNDIITWVQIKYGDDIGWVEAGDLGRESL